MKFVIPLVHFSQIEFRRTFFLAALILFCAISVPRVAGAFDRRAPLHILPAGLSSLELSLATSRNHTRQFNSMGGLVAESRNKVLHSKLIPRYSLGKRWEIGGEVPIFIKRKREVTNMKGESLTTSESGGIGDLSLFGTYCWFDSRDGGLGLTTGVDIKVPTGDTDKGYGSGAWDLITRTSLTYRTPLGYPFLLVIHTWSGEDERNGVVTDKGDELELSFGIKTRFWKKLAIQASGFLTRLTEQRVREAGGKAMVFDGYETQGTFTALRYKPMKALELNLFHKYTRHHEETYYIGTTPFVLKASSNHKYGLAIKYFW